MRTTARRDGSDYVLKGSKTFITNGPGADVFLVYAKIDRGDPSGAGVATFIVERGMPGVTVGPPFKKMGMRDSPTSEVFFDDVRLGVEHLLGGKEKGRGGRSDTKDSLGNERSGVPAMAWGIIERCYDASLAVRARARAVRPPDRRVPGGAAQDHATCSSSCAPSRTSCIRTAWMQQNGVKDMPFVNASQGDVRADGRRRRAARRSRSTAATATWKSSASRSSRATPSCSSSAPARPTSTCSPAARELIGVQAHASE